VLLLNNTICLGVICQDADVVDAIPVRKPIECCDVSHAIVSDYLANCSPSAEDLLENKGANRASSLCAKCTPLGPGCERATHLNDIPKASSMRHIHGVDVDFVEKRRRRVNSGWEADLGGLADLAQVTCLDVPLDIGLEGWPPEAVEEGAACGVEALVAQLVISVMDKSVPRRGVGIELVATAVLLLPKLASSDKETVRSANKTSEHVSR